MPKSVAGLARAHTARVRKPARPSPEAIGRLPPIPEVLRPGLDILFVGINPGVMSGVKQLHFGNPQNYFWRGLFESGLVPRQILPEEGHLLWEEWNMSIVNLVQRTTPSASDLSWQEMRDAVPELYRKIRENPPRIVCFVGKGIYEAFVGRRGVALGLQHDVLGLAGAPDTPMELRPPDDPAAPLPPGRAYLFAMPSTSGRAAAYRAAEKLAYFRQLKHVRDCVGAHAAVDHDRLAALGPQTTSRYFARDAHD
ncbi:uracil DNA N-glycosylase Thp1 [Coemansia biformis]|uniref:Uracil DNA N-glycosylase Thp1 n=1 Tax=Coemansia biformis TaxID=1286918 RepID=A0A9W8D132_9FUNG|nr:uracil DNA N-glycosylase Thp1 [Coemansia biformis]